MSVGSDISVKLGLDTSMFSAGLLKAKAEAMALGGSLDKSFGSMGDGVSKMGGSLGGISGIFGSLGGAATIAAGAVLAVGAAAAITGAKMVSMAADFESAMAKVGATTGKSKEQLAALSDEMYGLVQQGSKLKMTDMAGIAGGLGSAGLEATADNITLVEKSMKALEAPSDKIIDLMSVLNVRYGAGTEEASRYMSGIAQMADETSATNDQIIEATMSLGRLEGMVASTGPELLTMAASTKAMGIPAAEVGTKWSSMLSNLSSNSKATQETFKELGMDQKQWFAALQESKNTGSNAPVLRFLRELDSRLQKSGNSAKQSLQLFGTEGMMLGGQLGAILPKYDSLLQKSQAAYDANTRLTEEYKRQTDTLNSMLEGIGAKFDAIGVKMGNTMLPVVKDVAYQVDQMMAKLMSGDLSGAFDQAYQALKSYDWVGAGTSIANSIYGGLLSLIAYNQHVFTTIGNDIANYDWRGLGSKISDFVSKGLQDIKTEATRLFNNMSSWVNAGNAQSLGETIGHGLVNAAKSIISAGMDIVGWLKQNVTVANVQTAFAALGSLIDLGIKAGKSFLDGIYKSVKEDTGSYFEGIYTAMVKLKTDIVELGKEIGKAGITWVVTQLDEVIAAIAGKLNPYLEKVNSIFGTNYAMPTSSGFTTYKTDVSGKYQQVKEDAYALGGAIYNVGGQNQSKINNMAFAQDAGIASFMGKPYDYMAYAKQQGIPYDTALANAYKLLTGEDSLNTEYAKKMYGGTTTGNLGTSTGNSLDVFSNLPPGIAQALGMSNVRNTATYPTATNNAATSALASQWTGGTVPVFVTNWGEGGSGTGVNAVAGTNSYGQSVNANGLPVGKFDSAKINTSGPGIGMVANNADFEDAICQVDIFGMTPGLGEALMESGALKPNAHPTSQKIAASVGYNGDYANPDGYGAIIGSLNGAAKTQTSTATKVSGIQLSTANKASTIQIGGMQSASYSFQAGTTAATQKNAQTMEASALNSKVIQEDGAYSCFNIWGQGAEQIKTGGAAAGQSQTTGGLAAKDSMMAGGNHIKDSSVAMGDGLKADFKTATNTMTSGIDGIFKTGSAFLATTFNGLFTGIGMGGGSTYVGNLGATGAFGGTSISGGGGWVGTRSTGGTNNASLGQVSWGGTAASQAASSGYSSGGNFGSVKWFADGGVINKPQIVGVGEAGPEAIIPIGELPNMVQKMMGNTGGSDGHTHAIYMDGKKVADAVGPAIVKRMQQGAGLKVR